MYLWTVRSALEHVHYLSRGALLAQAGARERLSGMDVLALDLPIRDRLRIVCSGGQHVGPALASIVARMVDQHAADTPWGPHWQDTSMPALALVRRYESQLHAQGLQWSAAAWALRGRGFYSHWLRGRGVTEAANVLAAAEEAVAAAADADGLTPIEAEGAREAERKLQIDDFRAALMSSDEDQSHP